MPRLCSSCTRPGKGKCLEFAVSPPPRTAFLDGRFVSNFAGPGVGVCPKSVFSIHSNAQTRASDRRTESRAPAHTHAHRNHPL
eukprot:4153361-Pleurochrysis_carterae.AAC.1